MLNKIGSILGILTVLASIFLWGESHYALASEVNELKERLEFKIVEDKLDSVEARLFKLMIIEERKGELSELESKHFLTLSNQKTRLEAQYEVLLK